MVKALGNQSARVRDSANLADSREYLSERWHPQRVFKPSTKQRRPESKRQFSDDMRRIYDDFQAAQTVLGLGDRSTEARIELQKAGICVPSRAKPMRQFSVRTIPQCDFNGLKRYIEGRADSAIPHVQGDCSTAVIRASGQVR